MLRCAQDDSQGVCHAEHSEASGAMGTEMLRCAQHDIRGSRQTLSAAKGDKQPVRSLDRCPRGTVERTYLQMSPFMLV